MHRRLVRLTVPSLAALSAAEYVAPNRHFALLLILDARGLNAATIGAAAERLLDEGLATVAVWGPDCERVHDIVDESCVLRDLREDRAGAVVMTGWYAARPLEEALRDIFDPPIDRAYAATCDTTLIVTVANERWAREVRSFLRHQTDSPAAP